MQIFMNCLIGWNLSVIVRNCTIASYQKAWYMYDCYYCVSLQNQCQRLLNGHLLVDLQTLHHLPNTLVENPGLCSILVPSDYVFNFQDKIG